jgi:hypothetical protein
LLVLKDCLHTLPKHGVIGLTKTAALEYAKQGTNVQELYKPHDGSPYGKKKEAIEQFTALEPVGRGSQK